MRGCVHNFEKKTSANEIKSQGYVSLQPNLRQFLYDLVMGRPSSMFGVRSFKAKNRVFKFDYQKMNTFEFVQCWKQQYSSLFDD